LSLSLSLFLSPLSLFWSALVVGVVGVATVKYFPFLVQFEEGFFRLNLGFYSWGPRL